MFTLIENEVTHHPGYKQWLLLMAYVALQLIFLSVNFAIEQDRNMKQMDTNTSRRSI